MNPQTLQSLAALFASMAGFLGGMYLVVTRPLVKHIDDVKADLKEVKEELKEVKKGLADLEKKVDALEIKAWK